VPPLVIGLLRTKALKHFPSDNLAGLGIGAAFGILIPELHKLHFRNESLSFSTSRDGLGLSMRWNPSLSGR
jgi:hypothetical protein